MSTQGETPGQRTSTLQLGRPLPEDLVDCTDPVSAPDWAANDE